MRYLGGKTKIAKHISDYLKSKRKEGQVYFEPMCGMFSVGSLMNGDCIFNDYHTGLIRMFQLIQMDRFTYPEHIIQSLEYNRIRDIKDSSNPDHAFVGFGLSYAGKWFGGYDSWEDRHGNPGGVQKASVNSLKRKFAKEHIKNATFTNCDYKMFNPRDMMIYVDPPYANTTGYSGVESFNHDDFWNVMREWSKHNDVYISEYTAPADFKEVWRKKSKVQMSLKQRDTIEKLFKLN